MIDLIVFSLTIYLKYLLFYLYLYFAGRSLIIILGKLFLKNFRPPNYLLETKTNIFYPILGALFLGNLLIFSNFFIPLKSNGIIVLLLLLLVPNLFEINLKINIKNKISIDNFIYFVFIPAVLLISSSDINFHYDAAYYHLNNQNWLRESNLIIGFVNIFWPFGMSSIYEYLSSILWLEGSFIFIHFLSLIFIHFLYSFIYFQVFFSKINFLRNGSILLLFFSILDNFGFQGGRNGFIYIQEVGKQDIPVAILLSIMSLLIIYQLKKANLEVLDFICISLISLFIIQLKVSGVYILYLYFILIIYALRKNIFNYKKILILHIPVSLLSFIWILKNYLTTGCLVFPLSLTCKNNFDWYVKGSTERVEEYTTSTSFAYMEYFLDSNSNFTDWIQEFFYSETYSVFADYYRSVYLNFTISAIIIILLKIILFKNFNIKDNFILLAASYLFISATYLIFFGPIPRYTIGFLCTFILFLGFTTNEFRFPINKVFLYILFAISIGLLPRLNSYVNFIESKNIALSDPRDGMNLNNSISSIEWIRPESGDRCWINLNCTMEEGKITIYKDGLFNVALKE